MITIRLDNGEHKGTTAVSKPSQMPIFSEHGLYDVE